MSANTDKIREIIALQAGIDVNALADDASFEQLGLDSMALVELIFAVEEAFDISVPFNAQDEADAGLASATVRAFIELVDGLVETKKVPA